MAGDPTGPFVTGDKIPNSTRFWNRLRDLPKSALPGAGQSRSRPAEIQVRNDTGANLAAHAVVNFDGVVISPSANLPEFKRQPCLKGITPATDHLEKVAVLLKPLAASPAGIGPAIVSGPVVVQVDLASGDTHAVAENGQTGHLKGGTSGNLILYRPAANGVQWCLVNLGVGAAGSPIRFVSTFQDGGADGDQDSPPTWTYTVKDYFTDEELGTELDMMWARANGKHAPGNIGFAIEIGGEWALIICDEGPFSEPFECEA